ncbi:threonine synthase [Legionella sp. W05-934-2]|uniref:threonine synthase n=1 Tax=Legionella sp. W05-934-2 TaxID=1198649 RepID=UPI003461EEFF
MMISTREGRETTIEQAILNGLASDGGLYVPKQFPCYDQDTLRQCNHLAEFAYHLLHPYFIETSISLTLADCQQIFNFSMPTVKLPSGRLVLELFHGPTLSFKDFGARFFAHCLEQLAIKRPVKVIVATSGDTGSAVAAALYHKNNVTGYILFPEGKISARQQQQITCWLDNIHAIAVKGNFDDCQKMVKGMMASGAERIQLTTANSINIARLLPQQLFYAYTSTQLHKQYHAPIDFVVPSGNLGNVVACYWAKQTGFPVGDIYIANNANDVLSKYLNTGEYHPQPTKMTLANAMDVGNPSNLERLVHLLGDFTTFKEAVNAQSVSDPQIEQAIKQAYHDEGYILCPHTATAYYRSLSLETKQPPVIVATAHPAKFNAIVEPLVNVPIETPSSLQAMLEKPATYQTIQPDMESFRQIVELI